jgi:hypothetical protein
MPVPTPPPRTSPLRLAAMRRTEPEPVWAPASTIDPQCSVGYWNHVCPAALCSTWVPNHRATCAQHEPAEEATA